MWSIIGKGSCSHGCRCCATQLQSQGSGMLGRPAHHTACGLAKQLRVSQQSWVLPHTVNMSATGQKIPSTSERQPRITLGDHHIFRYSLERELNKQQMIFFSRKVKSSTSACTSLSHLLNIMQQVCKICTSTLM